MKKTLKILIICLITFTATAFSNWSIPVRISQPGGGYYPRIITQGDTVHAVYEDQRQYDKICYIRSTNSGETWNQYRILSERDGETIFPNLICWNQHLIAFWRVQFSQGPNRLNIGYAYSADDGLNWSSPQYIFDSNWRYINSYVSSANDSILNIELYSDADTENYFYKVRSSNFGQSWSQASPIFSVYQADSPDQFNRGSVVHLVWGGRFVTDSSWEVNYLRSTDGGFNWSENVRISEGDLIDSYWPSIFADNLGSVKISWMDYKYSPYLSTGDIFFRQSLDSGNTWLSECQLTDNHYAKRSDLVCDGDTIVVAWEDLRPENGQGSIFVIRSDDGGQSWGEPEWVDEDYNSSRNPAIAASNNKIYLIWEESGIAGDSSGLYFSRWDPEPDGIEIDASIPNAPSLSAYPNPFNSATTITLAGAEQAEIGIYDITGRLITTLHTVGGQALWDASAYSSGLYFARLAGEKASAIKLILLR